MYDFVARATNFVAHATNFVARATNFVACGMLITRLPLLYLTQSLITTTYK